MDVVYARLRNSAHELQRQWGSTLHLFASIRYQPTARPLIYLSRYCWRSEPDSSNFPCIFSYHCNNLMLYIIISIISGNNVCCQHHNVHMSIKKYFLSYGQIASAGESAKFQFMSSMVRYAACQHRDSDSNHDIKPIERPTGYHYASEISQTERNRTHSRRW